MNVAPSNPHCGPVAPSISAFLRSTPRAMAICALSVTTMALSTSIPMAMINPANEVRFSPTPKKDMISNVPPIEKISDEPISTPARKPITNMIITITIRIDSIRLMINPLLASLAISFSRYRLCSSSPTGISGNNSSSLAFTFLPVCTTSRCGSVETPMPMARLPFTCMMLDGGSMYPFSMTAISPSFTCPAWVVITWLRISSTVVYIPLAVTRSCCSPARISPVLIIWFCDCNRLASCFGSMPIPTSLLVEIKILTTSVCVPNRATFITPSAVTTCVLIRSAQLRISSYV